MQLEDWLDDLCVRFIINLPLEELQSVERICFQVEEAQWFYEDFIRPLDPSLPSLSLRAFSLRIFQHCPLFSQWSAQHHTTAFAEFLAYKSRVPVRGAIMLNEAMDEVVLVKGWKKSANWSFPRGKINKDESDLDCAVREVYEETGFDIRAAGLVKEEKDMKYIEVTMREQHMRLYVFRGVPRDTHFEPKTRKEISKIEWYKLTDLPTLKKNRPQEGSDVPAINANKFYMVAPFLHPLKKWIAQQKKKENRYSSHLSAPPMVVEEATTEDEREFAVRRAETPPQRLSDLPEVSTAAASVDPTTHLKSILNIGSVGIGHSADVSRQTHMERVDTNKSNALLALLRGGSTQTQDTLQTPVEQVSEPPEVQLPSIPSQSRTLQLVQPHPPLHITLPLHSQLQGYQSSQPHMTLQQPQIAVSGSTQGSSHEQLGVGSDQAYSGRLQQQVAPYQRTGDPRFAPQGLDGEQPAIPPASALPKLTTHTKALLDVFKAPVSSSTTQSATSIPLDKQALLSSFFKPGSTQPQAGPLAVPNVPMVAPLATSTQGTHTFSASYAAVVQPLPMAKNGPALQSTPSTGLQRSEPSHQRSLLELFTASKPYSSALPTGVEQPKEAHPVELADTNQELSVKKSQRANDDTLLALLKQTQNPPRKPSETIRPSPREGETSATISGPLNQPDFDAIPKPPRQVTNGMGRSPLTTNRTLYDPNRPAPVRILNRQEENRTQPPRSPRSPKPPPKRSAKDKSTTNKEGTKPFQPQILRRPQTAGSNEGAVAPEPVVQDGSSASRLAETSSNSVSTPPNPTVETSVSPRPSLQADAHKQSLQSLFGPAADNTSTAAAVRPPSTLVSPLSAGQIGSPIGEVPYGGFEPISTRTSRGGSVGSIASGPLAGRSANEKRQTGAENKAFLLGYLGRIANQEGS